MGKSSLGPPALESLLLPPAFCGPGFLESGNGPHHSGLGPRDPGVLSLIPECPGHEEKPRTARETGKDSSCFSEARGSGLSCLKEAGVWAGQGAGYTAPPFPTWKRRKHNISWENWSLVRGPTVDILGRERSVGRGGGRGWAMCWVAVIAGDSLRNEPFPAHCAHSGLRKIRTQRGSEASWLRQWYNSCIPLHAHSSLSWEAAPKQGQLTPENTFSCGLGCSFASLVRWGRLGLRDGGSVTH